MNRIRVIIEVEYPLDYEPVSVDECQQAAEKAIHEVIREGGHGEIIEIEADEANRD